MPCNCGKKKRPAPRPTSKKQPTPTPAKSSGTTQEFALITSTGRKLTYGSRLEADAANVRSGGTGTVRRTS